MRYLHVTQFGIGANIYYACMSQGNTRRMSMEYVQTPETLF